LPEVERRSSVFKQFDDAQVVISVHVRDENAAQAAEQRCGSPHSKATHKLAVGSLAAV
jgi:hypothetical protein